MFLFFLFFFSSSITLNNGQDLTITVTDFFLCRTCL